MATVLRPSLLGPALAALVALAPALARAQEGPALPPPRDIPGITVEDRFPSACVDCHLLYPEEGVDARFSTLLARWAGEVEPTLMEKVRAASGPGVTLTGRHPETKPEVLARIPEACTGCHTRRYDEAPDMARMVHLVHLRGGEDNVFLTRFQGECTHCHKLDTDAGTWTVPSAPERQDGG